MLSAIADMALHVVTYTKMWSAKRPGPGPQNLGKGTMQLVIANPSLNFPIIIDTLY